MSALFCDFEADSLRKVSDIVFLERDLFQSILEFCLGLVILALKLVKLLLELLVLPFERVFGKKKVIYSVSIIYLVVQFLTGGLDFWRVSLSLNPADRSFNVILRFRRQKQAFLRLIVP